MKRISVNMQRFCFVDTSMLLLSPMMAVYMVIIVRMGSYSITISLQTHIYVLRWYFEPANLNICVLVYLM
jgi:hypothetical protein